MKQIRKAVIPAAGFGTRFLPQTKAMPKEMLPIVDKPVIQHIVEKLVEAGIEDVIIVTGYHKRSIEDHFDAPSSDLVENLKMGGEKKKPLLDAVYRVADMANFVFVRQKGPYGNGTPMLNVRHIVGDEPFIYTWCDDMIVSEPNEFRQLIDIYDKYKCSVMAAIRANSDKDYEQYGYAAGKELEPGLIDSETTIEKPGKANAPSDLATVSSFVFTPDIFGYLEQAKDNLKAGNELYWNDAVSLMKKDGHRILAAEIKGKYYDTGKKLEYLKTVVDFALMDKDLNGEFKDYLKGLEL